MRDLNILYTDYNKSVDHIPLGYSIFQNPNERHVLKCPVVDQMLELSDFRYDEIVRTEGYADLYFYISLSDKETEVMHFQWVDSEFKIEKSTNQCGPWLDDVEYID